ARMNGLRSARARRAEYRVDVEITLDAQRLVGRLYVQRVAVGIGIHSHRAHAQAPSRTHDAAGDLAAVGDQDFLEHQAALRFSRNEAMPSRPSGETRISAMRFAVSAASASSTGRPATARISSLILRCACGPPCMRWATRPSIEESSSEVETSNDSSPM